MAEYEEGGEFSLNEFLRSYSLPQRVRVTEGFYDPQHLDHEFSNGDVLDLRRVVAPTVVLSYVNPSSGRDVRVSVSTKQPATFKVHPYDPENPQPSGSGKRVVLQTAGDLLRAWPHVVQTTRACVMPERGASFQIGEKLTLVRHVIQPKGDGEFVECKSDTHTNLLQLPLDCRGDFVPLLDPRSYTLAELVFATVSVRRRLRLSEDGINNSSRPIAGIPAGYKGDIFMDRPSYFVHAHPADSPGHTFVIPIETDISVAVRENTYMGRLFHEYDLESFVNANQSRFPLVVKLTNWTQVPSVLQIVRLNIRGEFILHRVVQEQMILCATSTGKFCVLPLSPGIRVRVVPKRFTSIEQLVGDKLFTVKVIRGEPPHAGDYSSNIEHTGVSGTQTGDTLRMKLGRPSKITLTTLGGPKGKMEEHVEVLLMERLGHSDVDSVSSVNVPLKHGGEYQEVLPDDLRGEVRLSDISPSCYPINVFMLRDPSQQESPLFTDALLELNTAISERCVLASKMVSGSPRSFQLPVRTKISVVFARDWKQAIIPDLLPTEGAEEVTEATYRHLLTLATVYDRIDVAPPLPPRHTDNSARRAPGRSVALAEMGAPPSVPPCQVHRAVSTSAAHEYTANDIEGRSSTLPRTLADTRISERASRNSGDDYEEMVMKDYTLVYEELFGSETAPCVQVPANGDISGFTWQELLVFLQLLNVEPRALLRCRGHQIKGSDFAKMTDEQLTYYGMDNAVMKHFRDKSKNVLLGYL